jgi:hypothetical protein
MTRQPYNQRPSDVSQPKQLNDDDIQRATLQLLDRLVPVEYPSTDMSAREGFELVDTNDKRRFHARRVMIMALGRN